MQLIEPAKTMHGGGEFACTVNDQLFLPCMHSNELLNSKGCGKRQGTNRQALAHTNL